MKMYSIPTLLEEPFAQRLSGKNRLPQNFPPEMDGINYQKFMQQKHGFVWENQHLKPTNTHGGFAAILHGY
jgi:hypothetical protein